MHISAELQTFAEHSTQAWGTREGANVAAFYSPQGNWSVNGGPPASSRPAITEVEQGFMRDFPDLQIFMDGLSVANEKICYRWTLTGTYRETGKSVRISGRELWRIGSDGLIAESQGHFDAAEYERQIQRKA